MLSKTEDQRKLTLKYELLYWKILYSICSPSRKGENTNPTYDFKYTLPQDLLKSRHLTLRDSVHEYECWMPENTSQQVVLWTSCMRKTHKALLDLIYTNAEI